MIGNQCAACRADRRFCICQPHPHVYGAAQLPPKGCICPPTSEKTCEALDCPRKGTFTTAAGTVLAQPKEPE